ncbi:MAG TPA: TMEM165/GDT1 family protein [Jatrophihabitans sp.]|jgi:putative Ca2+/H+ antiporter (TMEM165/GDT1 family)
MSSFLAVFAIAFAAILLVELPDKTMVATLVLSTRYRRRPVLAGAAAAFAVQCVVAVTAGGLLHLLPHRILEATVALLFAVGAVLLFRESVSTEDDQLETPAETGLSDRRIFGISFGVLFAAEWGDASQLATAGLVARYGQPVATGLGAFLALVSVAALAVLIGKAILRRVPLVLVHRVAAVAFTVFAVLAAVAAIRG